MSIDWFEYSRRSNTGFCKKRWAGYELTRFSESESESACNEEFERACERVRK